MALFNTNAKELAEFENEDGFESNVGTEAIVSYGRLLPQILQAMFDNATDKTREDQQVWMQSFLIMTIKGNRLPIREAFTPFGSLE